MKTLAIILALLLPMTAVANPALNDVTKEELYEALVICDARLTDRDLQHENCLNKLSTRTSTAIDSLVVPQPIKEKDGFGTEWLIIAGVSGIVLGIVLGVVLGGSGTTVVK